MKIYQISLNWSAFDARNRSWEEITLESGCKPDTGWLDPFTRRPLLKGEFGCSVSHFRIWQKIAASDDVAIVLEEDAIFDQIDLIEVKNLLLTHDSVWLGSRENELGYWYNSHAYALTPDAARNLCDGFSQAIIPVDEWMPKILSKSANYFYRPEIVRQIPRDIRPSEIEGTDQLGSEDMDIDFRIVTVATDVPSMWPLEKSASKYDVKVNNIGAGLEWRDDMTSHAGMPKIEAMRNFLKEVPDNAIVLFMDGYDTIFTDHPAICVDRFKQIGAHIVFGAESSLWPFSLQRNFDDWPDTGTPYRFLNSGVYMGWAWALRDFLNMEVDGDLGDDQLFCQLRYLLCKEDINSKISVALDVEAYIFQNYEPEVKMLGGQLLNPITNCCGVIYHGNGGVEAKEHFLNVADWFGISYSSKVSAPPILSLEYEEVAQDILVCDFLSEVQCQNLISLCESAGGWGELSGDKFPAQEIRLKRLGLFAEYEKLWADHLGKIAEKHWHPMEHIGLRDAFAMRYSTDTQTSLGLHTDASLVTGSVKLNDDYDGAELVFPRQYFNNSSVEIGKCILFPSQVTHGHFVPELKSGIKYSLTMWTSRYAGDVN